MELASPIVNKMASFGFACSIFALFISRILCFKPVIILHGVLDGAADLQNLAVFIKDAHPGTNVTIVNLFNEIESFKPLLEQVEVITAKVRPIMREAHDGVHIIGFSQGVFKFCEK